MLFVEQMESMMANSYPVAKAFVDFWAALDHLWFTACIEKLNRLGIPLAFTRWLEVWVRNRRAFIEIADKRSDWFSVERGGPQSSSLTPSIFISYHSDMGDALPMAISLFFVDDLATTMTGKMVIRFTEQCIDVEKRLKSFCDSLGYYAPVAVQLIN